MTALLKLKHITKKFSLSRKLELTALNDISLDIHKGETLGIVGESGCGKSTLARVITGVYPPTSGQINYEEQPVHLDTVNNRLSYAKKVQMVFQDPYSSLDPRMSIGSIISEGMEIHHLYDKHKRQQKVEELLELVGLSKDHIHRFPHEFSGGQRQRIGIARALAIEPELIVCDEPLSSLDISVQGQIVNLLKKLQSELGLTYLFVAHDLTMVRYISKRIAVMYLGNVVELADSDELSLNPVHPYTRALLQAVLIADPDSGNLKSRTILEGEVTTDASATAGCSFANRCSHAADICRKQTPKLESLSAEHQVACHIIRKS